jgi:uncharacterized LabA/DUF88 family protein
MAAIKKSAVLLDLGFVLQKLYERLGKRHANALEVRNFAQRCIAADEELFRIYCYHCPPYDQTETHPLTGAAVNFTANKTYIGMNNLIRDLKVADHIAFRAGQLSFDGWIIKKRKAEEIIKTGRALAAGDFAPDLNQKIVDMKIGLDVAWLSSRRIVDRIVLVTGDSDFIPAMKFARREGVQVVLVTMGHKLIKRELLEHADELRAVTFP